LALILWNVPTTPRLKVDQFVGWAERSEAHASMTDDDVGTARRAFAHPTLAVGQALPHYFT